MIRRFVLVVLFVLPHIASNSGCRWHNAIEFWSNVICFMEDVKTVNFYDVHENGRSSIFLEQCSRAFVHNIACKCETTIVSRIYALRDTDNLTSFVNSYNVAPRPVKQLSIWKITSDDVISSRVMPSVTKKIRIRCSKTFNRNTWDVHVILVRDIHSFDQISRDNTTFKWNSYDRFIVLIARFQEKHELSNEPDSRIGDILRKLWSKRKVQKIFVSEVMLVNNTVRINQIVRTYNPFAKVNDSVWGEVEIINVKTAEEASNILSHLTYHRTENMNKYELKVGYFKQDERSFEPIKIESHTYYADAFKKFDEIILNTIAQNMNFKVEYIHPINNESFGRRLPNGTYVGAIGDIVHGRTDICFVSFFVKKYGTNLKEDIDFSTYVDFDKLCMVVPKATKIPKGIRMYHFFPLPVWICSMLMYIFTYLTWYFLQVFTPERTREKSFRVTIYQSFLLTAGCPQKLPNTNAERILLSGILLANVTLAGLFSGILYNSFAHDMYYPDIDSLQDLDNSGLPISLSSLNLIDLFDDGNNNNDDNDYDMNNNNDNNDDDNNDDDDDNNNDDGDGNGDGDDDDDDNNDNSDNDDDDINSILLMRRLRKKMQFGMNTVNNTAYYRNISAFVRESHFPLIIEQFADTDSGPLLHLVKECPGKFYLSYLLPKDSILKERINALISQLNQAGLPSLWNRHITHAFIVQKRSLTKEKLARNRKEMNDFVPFNLSDVQSSFYMLLIGLLISTIIFFHEKGWLKAPLLHIEKTSSKSTR